MQMQLWPMLLRPKLKARQHTQPRDKNINLKFTTRTFSTPASTATATTTTVILYTFIINTLLLITTTWGLTVTQQPVGNYEGASDVDDSAVVSALAGLSNGFATSNYMKNYYQVGETEGTKQQQFQQQQQHQNNAAAAAMNSGHQPEMNAGAVFGRGASAVLQTNNYANSLMSRGASIGVEGGEVALNKNPFNIYDSGFVPTTFTAAGQHYAATLGGVQAVTDKTNTLYSYATTTANKNDLHTNPQPYVNVNTNNNNNNDVVTKVDNNKSEHSLFRRLSNYGGPLNNKDSDGDARDTHLDAADIDGGDAAFGGTDPAEVMQNYALAYTDDGQQTSLLRNFYRQPATFNYAQSLPEQTPANYFPSTVAATAGHGIQNQQNYFTLNNQPTINGPHQLFEHANYLQYQQQSQENHQPYEMSQQQQQQQQQTNNKLEVLTTTSAPATYYQTYIEHKNNNVEQRHQHRHIAADNYHRWKENQIKANYEPNQSAIEGHQQQHHTHQSQHQQANLLQEPETAETTHTARIKKSPKHKSKRHDNHDVYEHNYNYDDTLLEQTDNTVEHGTDDISSTQLHQLEKLQEQLQLQQQQFIELQHQLIDHDQQLQIQKHIANIPAPTLPPITQTVHHNPHSLQALAGSPLSKHTQVIKMIPIPHHQQVHIPYRENVTIEVPDPVIAPIRKPFAIQIPITRTVAVPKIQEVKIPIEKVRPFPVERPIPYLVERRVPYTVEKQIAQPVYYPVPIKVPIFHTVVHKIHKPPGVQHRHQPSYHLPHTVYQKNHGHSHGHGHYYQN